MQTERDTHWERQPHPGRDTHSWEVDTHTHTEGEKLKQGERDTHSHTERDTQALRETHTHNLEGETHTLSNTQTLRADIQHWGRHTMRQKHTHGDRDTLRDTQTETLWESQWETHTHRHTMKGTHTHWDLAMHTERDKHTLTLRKTHTWKRHRVWKS